jgi:hypothetical protein
MWTAAVAAALAAGGCDNPERPFALMPAGDLVVESDPSGAIIGLNGQNTGKRTPDTLFAVPSGDNQLLLVLDTGGIVYGWSERIIAPPEGTVGRLVRPLVLPCVTSACPSWSRNHTVNGLRVASNPAGALLYRGGQGLGLFWPAGSQNSYASIGMPIFAGVLESSGDTVALGPYSVDYVHGRPVPELRESPFLLRQETWVVPRNSALVTVRGISIRQEVAAASAVPDAVLVRLVFTNISDSEAYRGADRGVPAGGITYQTAYLGFALDADIGSPGTTGSSEDDLVSYVPELNLAFAYDADFRAPGFGSYEQRPGLVGLRLVERPEATTVYLNAWIRSGQTSLDWRSGDVTEPAGLRWMTATHGGLSNHSHPRVGYAPPGTDAASDFRMLVSAGPVRLAPGDSAVITVAILVAEPVPGTFTSGERVAPGDPLVAERQIRLVADTLVSRAARVGQPPPD